MDVTIHRAANGGGLVIEHVALESTAQSAVDAAQAAVAVAQAAVTAAEAAVIAAQLAAAKVDLFNSAEQFVFPETTNGFVLLTAGAPANSFGAWTEVVDNNGVKLSSKFTGSPGYLREITLHVFSVANQKYLVEIAYNGGANNIARVKVYSDWTYVLDVRSQHIPMGATIVCRMMAETAGATCRADFRYMLG